jgi:hypothetical protein
MQADTFGLTLGDLTGHRHDRYVTVYRALHLLAGMARRGWLRGHDVIKPIGAEVQDKKAMDAFQAAHLLPCDLKINAAEGVHEQFVSPIIRGNVKVQVFGRTNVVHRLVNYADRRCEANGWIDAFVQAARDLARGAEADAVFDRAVVPAFARAVTVSRDKLVDALNQAERQAMGSNSPSSADGMKRERAAYRCRLPQARCCVTWKRWGSSRCRRSGRVSSPRRAGGAPRRSRPRCRWPGRPACSRRPR